MSLRQPEATSAGRAQAFNKAQVTRFFKILQEVFVENDIQPSRIWNVDESAISTVHRPQKILAAKGKKQVGALTSAERGQHTTVVCCMSSSGNFVPPALIFARKKYKHELFDGTPTGTLGLVNESGWMTGELFLQWLKHFKEYANPSVENKVLLLVDGHSSHKHVDVLTYAKENGILMISFPPHCTHRLQPLDVAFFGPLKIYYSQEATKWLRVHPGRVITQYQVGSLFSVAYGKAATNQNAVSGFSKTGIWPLNPDIFPDYVFSAALTTDRPVQEHELHETTEEVDVFSAAMTTDRPVQKHELHETTEEAASSTTVSPGSALIRAVDISSFPVASTISRKRKHEGSQILTSDLYVAKVQAKAVEKKQLEIKRAARQTRMKLRHEADVKKEFQSDDNDVPCLYCNDLFSDSKPEEMWLKCNKCSKWAHNQCAGLSKKAKQFICHICK